jgi:hypothetical protein
MSTSEFQDPRTSRAWQRAVSDELVDGVGEVVVEFFDEGRSRRWSWWERPAASALLVAAEDRDREFDAVVVGEYERAFHRDQFREVVARLNAVGRAGLVARGRRAGGVGQPGSFGVDDAAGCAGAA